MLSGSSFQCHWAQECPAVSQCQSAAQEQWHICVSMSQCHQAKKQCLSVSMSVGSTIAMTHFYLNISLQHKISQCQWAVNKSNDIFVFLRPGNKGRSVQLQNQHGLNTQTRSKETNKWEEKKQLNRQQAISLIAKKYSQITCTGWTPRAPAVHPEKYKCSSWEILYLTFEHKLNLMSRCTKVNTI